MRSQLGGCLLAAMLVQAGCASNSTTDMDRLPAEELPVGSSFFLNHDINVRSGLLGVGIPGIQIQDGRIVARFKVQQFEPYCEFLLNARAQGETLVTADNFVVESVSLSRNFMQLDRRPTLVAAGPGFQLVDSESGSPGFTMFVVDYSLSSEFQGEGYTLRCRSVGDPATGAALTIGELRETLGTLFSVQPAINRSLDIQ